MKRPALFSPVLLVTLVAVVLGMLLLGFYIQLRSDEEAYVIDAAGPGSHSSSSLGHAGLADILERLGIPVVKSEKGSLAKADGGLLIVAEPKFQFRAGAKLRALLKAEKVLLVLPKWYGPPQFFDRGRIVYAYERSTFNALRLLRLVAGKGKVKRVESVPAWTVNRFGRTPLIERPIQLMESADMRPLIAAKAGVLLGEITKGTQRIWVLSDPDVLANHGLGKNGEKNAVLAVELIKFMRMGHGKVVFDEEMHGHIRPASAASAKRLLEFPYSVLGALGLMAIILLLWATMGRFGKPERAAVVLAAGKEGLIDNIARLMDYAGHERAMVRRYTEAAIRDTARQLRAPKGLTDHELAAWLERVGRARGVTLDSAAILRQAEDLSRSSYTDDAALAGVAWSIYRWKQEIIHGPSKRLRDH